MLNLSFVYKPVLYVFLTEITQETIFWLFGAKSLSCLFYATLAGLYGKQKIKTLFLRCS